MAVLCVICRLSIAGKDLGQVSGLVSAIHLSANYKSLPRSKECWTSAPVIRWEEVSEWSRRSTSLGGASSFTFGFQCRPDALFYQRRLRCDHARCVVFHLVLNCFKPTPCPAGCA